MGRRLGSPVGIFIGVLVCAVFVLLVTQISDMGLRAAPELRRDVQLFREIQPDFASDFDIDTDEKSVPDIVKIQERLLEQETATYKFPNNQPLQKFMLSKGGQPIRNIILTTWRSGSTFVGDVLNAIPGNYYHYEPLLDFDIIQIRGPPHADLAIRNLRKLLSCDYSDMMHYLDYGKSHIYLFTHNTRLWGQCMMYQKYCWDPEFLTQFCRLFPIQSMKVVRLRLRLAEELLKDESINAKILLLVRDPRGTLQSRKHRDWCPGQPDCDQPNLLCADMVSDYSAAIKFQKLYPERFRAMRYEDLSLNPYEGVEQLFTFFNLSMHANVINFLDSHTKLDVGGVSSTFRNSKSAPFHWRTDLNFTEVQHIEHNCEQAMKHWGYVRAHNETSVKSFNPLTSYSLISSDV